MPHAKSGMGVYNANKQTPKCIYVLVLIGMYIEMLHGKFFIVLKLIKKIIQHIISNFWNLHVSSQWEKLLGFFYINIILF